MVDVEEGGAWRGRLATGSRVPLTMTLRGRMILSPSQMVRGTWHGNRWLASPSTRSAGAAPARRPSLSLSEPLQVSSRTGSPRAASPRFSPSHARGRRRGVQDHPHELARGAWTRQRRRWRVAVHLDRHGPRVRRLRRRGGRCRRAWGSPPSDPTARTNGCAPRTPRATCRARRPASPRWRASRSRARVRASPRPRAC